MKSDGTFPNGSTLSQPGSSAVRNELGSAIPYILHTGSTSGGKDVEKALEPFVTRPGLCLDAGDDQWSCGGSHL